MRRVAPDDRRQIASSRDAQIMPNPIRLNAPLARHDGTTRRFGSARGAGAVAVFVLGAVLCYGGGAQLYAGLLEARAAAILETADWDRGVVPLSRIAPAVADLRAADRWWPRPINAYDRGMAQARVAGQNGAKGADRALLDTAMGDLRASIAQDPANAAAWAWLAYGSVIESGGARSTTDALFMSIQLARFDPTLLPMRCEIGLTIYPTLNAQQRAALGDQIRLLGRNSIEDLVTVARLTHSLNVVMAALLQGDNATALRFMDMLRS
jgi:hypothetical protein